MKRIERMIIEMDYCKDESYILSKTTDCATAQNDHEVQTYYQPNIISICRNNAECKIITLDMNRVKAGILTPAIKSIYYSTTKKIIVINWVTGEKTKVTCQQNDEFNLEQGVSMAICKYVLGNNYNAYTILTKYIKSAKKSD